MSMSKNSGTHAARPDPDALRQAFLSDGPTGPAVEAAAVEHNWAVIQVVPRPDNPDKTDKPALDPATRRWCGHEQGAVLNLTEAFALARLAQLYRPSSRFVLAYMPRPGSALIAGDVDAKALTSGQPPSWLRAQMRFSGEFPSYVEHSPSGKGLRVLMARIPGAKPFSAEVGGIGFYAAAGKALTLTFARLPDSPRAVTAAPEVQAAFRKCTEPIDLDDATPVEGGGFHWFERQDEEHQLELVRQMLDALPEGGFPERDPNAEGSWFRVMCEVHHDLDGSAEAWELFDEWSRERAGGHYDAAEKGRIWQSLGAGNQGGERRTIGS
jgi:hypothetical protein